MVSTGGLSLVSQRVFAAPLIAATLPSFPLGKYMREYF